MVGIIARNIESGEFEKLIEHIPLHEQREKWRTARSGFTEADLANATRKIEVAVDKVEEQLGETEWLAGDDVHARRHQFLRPLRDDGRADVPRDRHGRACPRLLDWAERCAARPGVAAALEMPDHTNPALRTFTGEARGVEVGRDRNYRRGAGHRGPGSLT